MEGLKIVESGIVPVYEDREARVLVNARELHEFLGVSWKFTDWIQDRIEKYKFSEEDFFRFSGKSTGGRPMTDYLLTIDMAKELAMVENNDKGREVRRYFIECEKSLRSGVGIFAAKDAEKMRQRDRLLDIMNRNARTRQARMLKFVVEFFKEILSDVSLLAIADEILLLAAGKRLVDLPPETE
jgi:phage anti-repressor protein